ncbi:putative toxin-antitoxin system toxin component, PIN family [Candidatus Parcubacteria bacterium]|nr:putative toxin-antitoxin system toxin component, PIN family [Patescibacteria group bacterium]MBU4482441.1 putative toxin-antitoxin system toxin component, PIN family [Patescibacteria group bacterium]MCG2686932.1 putative toxin-antitoxin system toxin component, PIN family [Candidatus Parcubacteria bacterium]
MKIVLDTNVLIDATNDDFSWTWKIIDLVLSGKIGAVASEKILREYKLIIKRNIKRKQDKQKLEDFMARVEVILAPKKMNIIPDDPEDEKFVECAVEANADYIVSSDAHLLNLQEFENIKILDPKNFWYKYSGENDDENEWKDVFKGLFK